VVNTDISPTAKIHPLLRRPPGFKEEARALVGRLTQAGLLRFQKPRTRGFQAPPEMIARVRELRAQGHTIKSISKITGVPTTSVYAYLQ
jgi:hypothetical protein